MTLFLNQQRVLKVEKQFVAAGSDSFWAYQIHYDDALKPSQPPGLSAAGKKGLIDYKTILNDADFTLFLKLNPQRQGPNRVNRGGSFNNAAGNCRSANRHANQPTNRNNNLGFRPAAPAKPAGLEGPETPLSFGAPVPGANPHKPARRLFQVIHDRSPLRGGEVPGGAPHEAPGS